MGGGCSNMGKVVILATGGTIACKKDPVTNEVKPSLTGEDLIDTVPGIDQIANFEVENFSQLQGAALSLNHLLALAQRIKNILDRPDVSGVVITQGTDSIEETSYFFDIVVDSEKPVIVTGSMKTPFSLGFDGPANLADALVLASSEEVRGMGTLVVMNGIVYSARSAVKSNTIIPNAFTSVNQGAVGQVAEHKVYLFGGIKKQIKIPLLQNNIESIDVNVALIKAVLDPGNILLNCLVQSGIDGIVVEAMGAGHVPPCMLEPLGIAIEKNIPVVITSRCGTGPLLKNTYSFEGSEQSLKKLGVIFSNLTGLKARIKLIAALSLGEEGIAKYFNSE
jgi:L-asparaginase